MSLLVRTGGDLAIQQVILNPCHSSFIQNLIIYSLQILKPRSSFGRILTLCLVSLILLEIVGLLRRCYWTREPWKWSGRNFFYLRGDFWNYFFLISRGNAENGEEAAAPKIKKYFSKSAKGSDALAKNDQTPHPSVTQAKSQFFVLRNLKQAVSF